MPFYKKCKRQQIKRIDYQENGKKANQSFQLHTMIDLQILAICAVLYMAKDCRLFLKDGKDRVLARKRKLLFRGVFRAFEDCFQVDFSDLRNGEADEVTQEFRISFFVFSGMYEMGT
jgi:hypothetical protein